MTQGLFLSFIRYMESTRHLVLYRLDSKHCIPSTLCMPQVTTLIMIDCEPDRVGSILYRSYFPHLTQIHYLSRAPSDPLLYKRFPHLGFMGWTFPRLSQPYSFYDCMTEAGWGRKKQDLVSQYLVSSSFSSCSKNKNTPLFDLYLPEHGIVAGEYYREQQLAYFQKKQCDELKLPYPIRLEDTTYSNTIPPRLTSHAISDSRWIYQQKCLNRAFELQILNLPDATPYHNSNK